MKLTVIIPIYNKCKYLNTLLNQIKNQSFHDYECLLIDDGSSDNSEMICDRFSSEDDRFKVFHLKNGGVSRARNYGLKMSKGDYITFIDADDQVDRDYLENLYTCINNHCVDLVIGGCKKVDESLCVLGEIKPCFSGIISSQIFFDHFVSEQRKSGIYGYCFAKIYSKSILNGLYFDEKIKLAEDFDFNLKVYLKLEKVYLDSKTNYHYLQNATNSSVQVKDDQIDYLSQLKIWMRCKQMLLKRSALSGDNQRLVHERIEDYVFYSIFHCSVENLSGLFNELVQICKSEKIVLSGNTLFRKWIFYWLSCENIHVIKGTLVFNRKVRSLLRKGI